MKALALFGVLIVAKLLAVMDRELPWSLWTPFALFWQDALVALLFAAVAFVLRRKQAIVWSVYCLIVGYTAVNVPITRILSSPLTWQMSQATGGALSDSIAHYFTLATLSQMAAVVLTALALAIVCRQLNPTWTRICLGTLAVLTLAGAFAGQQVDCSGLHRNAVVAFIDSTLPRVESVAPTVHNDWRALSPMLWGKGRSDSEPDSAHGEFDRVRERLRGYT